MQAVLAFRTKELHSFAQQRTAALVRFCSVLLAAQLFLRRLGSLLTSSTLQSLWHTYTQAERKELMCSAIAKVEEFEASSTTWQAAQVCS